MGSDSQPFQRIYYILLSILYITGLHHRYIYLICILYSEDELAIVANSKQVVKEGSPDSSEVHGPGGRGSIPHSDREEESAAKAKVRAKHYYLGIIIKIVPHLIQLINEQIKMQGITDQRYELLEG